MPPARRRSRSGIPLAVVIAVLTAIFASRAGRSATPAGMPLPAPAASQTASHTAAQALRDASVGGAVLEVRRRDGAVSRFDRQSGAFIAFNADGTIRTFFRPNDGDAYFRRQASRVPSGGP